VIYMSIFEYDEQLHERTLLEEGMEIGEQRGMEIGARKGIRGTVTILRSLGHADSEIRAAITAEYDLSPEQAEQYIGSADESVSYEVRDIDIAGVRSTKQSV
ncbi:MAG: hypothetical protein IJ711_04665, partial [Lachnospiraceae bacterium]|nr:hypothetical protein [Lachnospiraceae bacterium]